MRTHTEIRPLEVLDQAFAPGRMHGFRCGKQAFGLLSYPPLAFQLNLPETEGSSAELTSHDLAPVVEELASLVAQYPSVPLPLRTLEEQTSVSVALNITDQCNLSCGYCCVQRKDSPSSIRRMGPDMARRAVDFVFEWPGFAKRDLSFAFHRACEPLLCLDEIHEVRKYIRDKAANTGRNALAGRLFGTNGTLVTEALLNDPRFAGIKVFLSMDGPREIHDGARVYKNGKGSYADAVRGLRLLQDRGLVMGGGAQVTGKDPRILERFLHNKNVGLLSTSMRPVRLPHDHPFSVNLSNVHHVKLEYSRFVQYLMNLHDGELIDCLVRLAGLDYFKRLLVRVLTPFGYPYRCPGALGEICIDVDGLVYPCAAIAGWKDFALGSVDDGIDEEKITDIFCHGAHVDNSPSCHKCWARYVCGGPCYAQAAMVNGDYLVPDPVECELIQHNTELAVVFAQHLKGRGSDLLAVLGYSQHSGPAPFPIYHCRANPMMSLPSEAPPANAEPIVCDELRQVRGKSWTGPDDLSATVHIWWNDRSLNLHAIVKDDVFFQPYDETWFTSGDCLRFALLDPQTEKLHEFGAALLSGGAGLFRTASGALVSRLDSAAVAIERIGSETTYRIAVPWDELGRRPAAGESWRFSLAVIDHDRTSAGRIEWCGGLLPKVDIRSLGFIVFEE